MWLHPTQHVPLFPPIYTAFSPPAASSFLTSVSFSRSPLHFRSFASLHAAINFNSDWPQVRLQRLSGRETPAESLRRTVAKMRMCRGVEERLVFVKELQKVMTIWPPSLLRREQHCLSLYNVY